MAGQNQRLNVVPTVTMLGVMKARLVGATRGHALLKRKTDPLTMQFRQISKNIVSTNEFMGGIMKTSYFTMSAAKYVPGDNIRHVVLEMSKMQLLNASFQSLIILPRESFEHLTGLAREMQSYFWVQQ